MCHKHIAMHLVLLLDLSYIKPLAAVDHPVIATIILSSNDDLTVQGIDAACSNLIYHVFFPNVSQQYTLYIHAKHPCNSAFVDLEA